MWNILDSGEKILKVSIKYHNNEYHSSGKLLGSFFAKNSCEGLESRGMKVKFILKRPYK